MHLDEGYTRDEITKTDENQCGDCHLPQIVRYGEEEMVMWLSVYRWRIERDSDSREQEGRDISMLES